MKFRLSIVSKAKRLFISSPSKEKTVNWGNPLAEFDYKAQPADFPDFGSREENFFDSRACLDSDCEDDFYSVTGDFTPQGSSTPNHQSSSMLARPQRTHFVDTYPESKSESSPTERKKRLAELLDENLQAEGMRNGQNHAVYNVNGDQPHKSLDEAPYLSGVDFIYNTDPNHKKKMTKSKHCCIPSFMPSFGCNESRKQKMSPEH